VGGQAVVGEKGVVGRERSHRGRHHPRPRRQHGRVGEYRDHLDRPVVGNVEIDPSVIDKAGFFNGNVIGQAAAALGGPDRGVPDDRERAIVTSRSSPLSLMARDTGDRHYDQPPRR
jgi:hypothetical protein